MFGKILVCSDASPASDLLIQCAGELKTIGMEEVVLAHVLQVVHAEGLDQRIAKESQSILERQKKALEQFGIKVTTDMPVSHEPARTLNDLAEKHDVSAIFIGSHGKGILRAATLGSVCAELLHEARTPVLLARITLLEGGECGLACRKMFTNALFPTDFSDVAENALNYLGKIAAETKCSSTIMHVLEVKPAYVFSATRIEEDCRLLLESKKRRLESLGAQDVGTDLVFGEPAKEILARTKEGDFSIVIMGTLGKGPLKEVFIGSVSNEVSRHVGIPVLLIPPAR